LKKDLSNRQSDSGLPRRSLSEGVFQLYDKKKNIIAIKSSSRLGEALLEALLENENTVRFDFEEDKVHSKHESKCIR
jgi:hypothetical protein